jgi:hypothetical protein
MSEANQSRCLLCQALVSLFVAAVVAAPIVPTEGNNLLNFGDLEGLAGANTAPWNEEGIEGTPPENLQLFIGADASFPERGNVIYVDYARGNAGIRQNMLDVEVLPNTTYRASFDYRTPDFIPPGADAGPIFFSGFSFGPAPIGTSFITGPFVFTSSEWQTYEFEFTTPANTDSLGFTILSGSDPNDPNISGGISFEIDDCKLVQLGVPKRPNHLLINAGFEDAVVDPNDPVPGWQVEGNPSTVISVSSDAHRGDSACRIDYSVQYAGVRQPLLVAPNDISPLGRYRLEFWYKSANTGSPAIFRTGLWEFSPSNNVLVSSSGITTSDEWQFYSYERTLTDPGINALRVVFQSFEAAAGSFLLDDVRLIELDTATGLTRNASFDDADPANPTQTPAEYVLSNAGQIISLTTESEGNNNFLRIHANGNGGIRQVFNANQGGAPETLYRMSCWYRAADPNDLKFSSPDQQPIHMVGNDFGGGQGNAFFNHTNSLVTSLVDPNVVIFDPNDFPGKNARGRQNWLRYPNLWFRTRPQVDSISILVTAQRNDTMWDVDDISVVRVCDLADFDGDGDVDVVDAQRFQDCFTAAMGDPNDPNILIDQTPEGVACKDADMDEDQDVDWVDLLLFEECWTGIGGTAISPSLGSYTFDDTTGTGAVIGNAMNPSGEDAAVTLSVLGTGPRAAYVGALNVIPPDPNDGFGFDNVDGNDVLYWKRALLGQPSHWGTPSGANTGVNDAGMNFTVTASGADVTVQGVLIEASGAAYINAFQIAGAALGNPVTAVDGTNFAQLNTPVTIVDGNTQTFTVLWNSGGFGTLLEVDSISVRGTVAP